MNIRDLQYLIAVHEFGSFSKAADACFVSQPTLSGQLKKLEESLGAKLMERTTRHILFTPIGEQVVEKAKEVMVSVDAIKRVAQQADDPMAGDFHLGIIPTIGPYLLPVIIKQLSSTFPQANFYLHELQTHDLIEKLQSGKLDAGILAKLDWDIPLREWHLYQEKFLLAVGENHNISAQLDSKTSINKQFLKGKCLLMLEDGHCLRDQALGVCFAAGADEDARFKATSMDTLIHMVATGSGITLVPELAAARKHTDIRYLEFDDPAPSREVVIITREKSVRTAAIESIANLISQLVVANQRREN